MTSPAKKALAFAIVFLLLGGALALVVEYRLWEYHLHLWETPTKNLNPLWLSSPLSVSAFAFSSSSYIYGRPVSKPKDRLRQKEKTRSWCDESTSYFI